LFLIILLIGINGVINLPENTALSNTFRFSRPLTWLSDIPKYSKILFLFFLGAEIFYNYLEAEAVSVLTRLPNTLADLKAAALVSFTIIGFLSAFLNFKPKTMPEGYIGPVKYLDAILRDISLNIFRRKG
jgi:hypothetical protein